MLILINETSKKKTLLTNAELEAIEIDIEKNRVSMSFFNTKLRSCLEFTKDGYGKLDISEVYLYLTKMIKKDIELYHTCYLTNKAITDILDTMLEEN